MNERKQGSIAVLILWIIFLWPVAIGYWFSRVWPKEMFDNVVSKDEMTVAQAKDVVAKDKANKVKKAKGAK